MVRLEDWALFYVGGEYTPPELLKRKLTGKVYGHPRFEDGVEITTSSLIEFDVSKCLAVTKNTTYTLGKASEEYLKLFPQAR